MPPSESLRDRSVTAATAVFLVGLATALAGAMLVSQGRAAGLALAAAGAELAACSGLVRRRGGRA